MMDTDRSESVILTEDFIAECGGACGGFTAEQFAILGVAWPPTTGWKRRLRGKLVSRANADRLLEIGRRQIAKRAAKRKHADPASQPTLF